MQTKVSELTKAAAQVAQGDYATELADGSLWRSCALVSETLPSFGLEEPSAEAIAAAAQAAEQCFVGAADASTLLGALFSGTF